MKKYLRLLPFLLIPLALASAQTVPVISPWYISSGSPLTATTITTSTTVKIPKLGGNGVLCIHTDNNGVLSTSTADCGGTFAGTATTTIFTNSTSTGPTFVFVTSGNNGITATGNNNVITFDIPTSTNVIFSSGTFNGNINVPNGWIRLYDDGAPPSVLNSIALFSTSTHGISRFTAMDENGSLYTISRDNFIIGKNSSGVPITKGQVLMVTGETGDVPDFAAHAATTSVATAMDVVGVAFENIAVNAFGRVLTKGILPAFNTSAFANGDVLYSSTTAGALTNQQPPYPYLSEIVGQVLAVGVGNGSVLVDLKETQRDEDGEITNSFRLGDQTSAPKYLVFDNSTTSRIRWAGNSSSTFNLPDIGGYNTFAVSSTNPITLGATGVIGFTNPGYVTATSTAFYANGTIIPYSSTTGFSFATSGASGIQIASSSGTWTWSQATSTDSVPGFLSSADHTTFNAKQSPLGANFVSSTSAGSGISVSATTGAITVSNTAPNVTSTYIGNGTITTDSLTLATSGPALGITCATTTCTFSLPTSTASQTGVLSSANWTTFNNKSASSTIYFPIEYIIENPSVSNANDANGSPIKIFRATSTIQSCSAVNRAVGDSVTFGLGYSSSASTATSSLTQVLSGTTTTVTATTTPATLTLNNVTPGNSYPLNIYFTSASSSRFILDCYYTEN